jgi:hypothetical protein
VNPAHRYLLSSYPLGYSLVVLPLTIARCVQFAHHDVSSAVIFFTVSIFNLSGVVNVLLFLIVRPRLLLLPRLKELDGQKIQSTPTRQGTGPAISPTRRNSNTVQSRPRLRGRMGALGIAQTTSDPDGCGSQVVTFFSFPLCTTLYSKHGLQTHCL